ncbi:MAG TPA: PHB depolymerase family esterase [Burkholderiaceae bacterium]
MARRKFSWLLPTSVRRALQRNTRTLVRTTLAGTRRAAASARQAVTRQAKPPPGKGDWLSGLALGPAGARGYHLFRPAGLRQGEQAPLLVMLHGCDQTGRDLAASSRMNLLAASGRCWVLYPEQDRMANLQGCWNWFARRSGKAEAEAATLHAMVNQVLQLYPVDGSRLALAGLSAGAGMAALLATLYPARWCAVAMHSGVAPGAARSTATALTAMVGKGTPDLGAAAPRGLPPLLVLQGMADAVVAPGNAVAAAQAWATALGAKARAPRAVQRGARYPMRVTDYATRGKVVVQLCEIEGLGHAWSGGAAGQPYSDPRGPDASRIVWAFVVRQFERLEGKG